MNEVNEWGDPVDTVYIVMYENRMYCAFKCWKKANEKADALNAEWLRAGEKDEFWVAAEPLL